MDGLHRRRLRAGAGRPQGGEAGEHVVPLLRKLSHQQRVLGIGRLVRSGEWINLERADLLRTAAADRELRGPPQGFLP